MHAWHETGSASVRYSSTVSVATALVGPETASSLMRALQTSGAIPMMSGCRTLVISSRSMPPRTVCLVG